MLAQSRRAKLITRNEYDTNSIITNNGANAIGAPAGRNKDNIWKPCVLTPIMLMAKKAISAKPKVTQI
jgi:hypothetical protein